MVITKHQCLGSVKQTNRHNGFVISAHQLYRCSRKGKYQDKYGNWYCKTHLPKAEQALKE